MGQLEKEALAADLAAAKTILQRYINTIPFDISAAGATRIEAWKLGVEEARKLLARNPADASKYREALRSLQTIASAPIGKVAVQAFGTPEQRQAAGL